MHSFFRSSPFVFLGGLLLIITIVIVASQVQKVSQKPKVSQPIKIMAVGDSMTEGHAGDYTWRYRLWKHLTTHKVSFDFVGPKTTVQNNKTGKQTHDYLDPAFDQDHDGAWGKQLEGTKGSIIDEMRIGNPDVLLVGLGTNDILSFMSPVDTMNDLRSFVANARWMNPNIKIVLSLLTPHVVKADDPWVVNRLKFNDQLVVLASQLSTTQSPIVIADPTQGFDPTVDTYDGTHPTPSGEFKIAAAFANALASLGIGTQYGSIPQAPAWPPAPTMVTVTPVDGPLSTPVQVVPN